MEHNCTLQQIMHSDIPITLNEINNFEFNILMKRGLEEAKSNESTIAKDVFAKLRQEISLC